MHPNCYLEAEKRAKKAIDTKFNTFCKSGQSRELVISHLQLRNGAKSVIYFSVYRKILHETIHRLFWDEDTGKYRDYLV